jgi:peptide/nickel transport system permease protein
MSVETVAVEDRGVLAATPVAPRALMRTLVRRPAFVVGAAILAFWILAAIFGPLAVHNPLAQNLAAINRPPSTAHLFGTDQLGRDVLARVIAGARPVLVVAPLATLIGTVAGSALGLAMGYFDGIFDDVVGRFVEAFMALPLVVVGILGVVALGGSDVTLIVVIGIVFTPLIARTVRAAVLQERELEYVAAARLRGERAPYVMFVEILPNVLAPIGVEFTVRLGYAVFTLVSLSFLGFGLQPPAPNWGSDIAANFGLVLAGYWWEVLFYALAIASLVIAVNLIASSIESVLAGDGQ